MTAVRRQQTSPTPRGPRSDYPRETEPWVDRHLTAAAELVVLEGGDVGRRYPIFGGEIIGRGEDADIQIDVDEVSRRHCMVRRAGASLLRVGAALQIEDLGSRNGTWVRGERLVQPRPLAFGERISLGSHVVLLLARHDGREREDDPLERFGTICDLVASAAERLDAAMATTLAAIDQLRASPPSATLADPAVRASLGDVIGSISHQLDLARQLHHLGRVEPNREGRVDLGQLCRQVARLLASQHADVVIREEIARVEVKGDLVELFQLLVGAANQLLEIAPEGGALKIACRVASLSQFDRRRRAVIEIARSGIEMVVPLSKLTLARELQRRAAFHGGRVDLIEGELGYLVQLPAVGRARDGATRDASASLTED